MWLKIELVMLMCILVDKDLAFTPVNQKDGKDEIKQNRYIMKPLRPNGVRDTG